MPLKAETKAFGGKNAVLVAVDFSARSEAALVWACRYAHRMKVPVITFHAVHEPADAPGFYKRDKRNQLRPLKDIASQMMTAFLKQVRKRNPKVPGVAKINGVLVKGLPVDRILTAAERLQAGLLVVGCRCRKGLPDLLIGSTAEQVIRQSPIPVTIVKSRNDGKRKK